ncbi:DUF748 domain-containing protein [Parahaliea aestuarii]|uniref:DUF748 domain-containing protein n=1 Tax=Parahaliea aestuarii TaxID=1852021 RepID=A0A5C8ZSK4_9GAMM|nr:DUF748 domain-containing protein [Parahaliea aestuarii]TXS91503.1 DUF748 domain-containing protein [Parahaliea aestuarii]
MRKLLRALALIYLGYLALSVLVILPLLNFVPPWFVHKQYQRDLDMELALFNPFALSLEVRQARLSEAPTTPVANIPDGDTFARLDSAEVNLSLASLWHSGWVFDAFAVEGIDVHLRRLADESLNISDFLAPGDAPPDSEPAGELPGVTVDDIRLSAYRIRVSDEARPTPYTTHWDELQIRMSDLSTVLEAGHPYHLRVLGEGGGSLEWQGELSIPQGYSTGNVALGNIDLRPFWRFVKDQVDFEVADGRLHFTTDYRVDWSGELSYALDRASLDITQLTLTPMNSEALPDTGVALAALGVKGIAVNGDSQQVTVDSAEVDGLRVSGWLEEERISLAELFRTRFGNSAVEDQEPPATGAEPARPWQVSLSRAAINGAEVLWRSPFTEPAQLAIAPLDIRVDNIRWPVQAPSAIDVSLVVNDTVTGQIDGELQLEAGDGTLNFAVKKIPLAWFGPNIPEILNARIDSGLASSEGSVSLSGFAPQAIALAGAVEDFGIQLYQTEDAFTRWNTLDWEGLEVDLPGRRVSLAQLHLDGYAGRIHIREDGSLNIQRLLREEAESQAEAARAAGEEAAPDEEAEPWQFSAPAIFISDSEVDFMDESLPLHFRTVIGDVNGEISGLSSDPGSELDVDIKGSVDGYAPVVLAGSASPFRAPPALDLNLTFQGVDLARLTPYSGTYAGYAIDRGTLNLDLKYSLAEDRLQGDNKVVIHQLKLGEKVDSDKALDIPLQLGIALLTDANGVIDLAVPVSGDVNNPSFELGSVIMGAFVNLITKAITAPFSLLASLVGSEDDLQRFNFAAGSTELDEHGRQKLLELAAAMAQRPQLKLVIGGRLNPDSDRQKLQQQLLQEALLADGLTEADISGKSDAWAEVIARRYAALAIPPEAATDDAEPPSPLAQSRRVQEQFPVPDAALKTLAEERAASSKRFLVNEGGIAADRAVIEQTDPAADYNSFSGVEMSVDT